MKTREHENKEIRACQNCTQDFTIDQEDFNFYKKLDVPSPTFCPQCRFQRRMMFRNERVFHKRPCELCGEEILTTFSPNRGRHVYCQPCWWSDKWDPLEYGKEYDPSKNFFEQLKELSLDTPYPALLNDYSLLTNSEYVNHAGSLKNCYLMFNADYCENVAYGVTTDYAKDSLDTNMLEKSELCYEVINCQQCFRTYFSEDCESCTDMYFCKDCVGCSYCFGCSGLRKRKYCWFNEEIGKEEFVKRLEESNLQSRAAVSKMIEKSRNHWLKFPNKYFHGTHNLNVSGDYIHESKNAHDMYQVRFVEDARYCQFITLPPAKSAYDWTEWGAAGELICDAITVGADSRNVQYCFASWSGAVNTQYCLYTHSCQDLFGCVNMKGKKHCILNKQYEKEEYMKLRERIVSDLEKNPYIDAKGRKWKYGEFLPYDISPFAYNESHAAQYYPLTKEEILERGWEWEEQKLSTHTITMPPEKIPDSIEEARESILDETLGCEKCKKPFRLIPLEFKLLKHFGLPIPVRCPDCRHFDRMDRVNPPKLWNRECGKCQRNIKTAYAPERPEIVYCEKCYQAEVM